MTGEVVAAAGREPIGWDQRCGERCGHPDCLHKDLEVSIEYIGTLMEYFVNSTNNITED